MNTEDKHVARTALVTGATSGIGLSAVRQLKLHGWSVLGTALAGQDATELHEAGAECIETDLTNPSALSELRHAVAAAPRLDALVSNAGVAIPGPIEGLSTEAIDAQFQLNAIAPMLLAKSVLPQLRATRGRMIFVGAGQGRLALPFGGPYGASKAALASLTDALRAEIADTGVTVSLIEPGAVRTSILTESRERGMNILDSLPTEVAQRYRDPLLATFARSDEAFANAISPDVIGQRIVQILTAKRPRPRYLVGREAKAFALAALLPAGPRSRLTSMIGRARNSE